MTTRNLDALFAPKSVALIGANARPGSVGGVLARNLLHAGFAGPIGLVDPQGGAIDGVPVATSIAELADPPELAVVAAPAAAVPQIVADLGAHGGRAAIVISAGFEGPGAPAELKRRMLEAARPHLLRIIGPNCLGVISPVTRLNASFAHAAPPPGGLALVAQSGAVAAAVIDWACRENVGFSHVVTLGDCADVDVADMLDALALDPATHGVLLYLEGVGDGRKFMSAARAAARLKPVAALKAGRSAAGARAALSHTGALAGPAAIHSAVLRRAGVLEVESLEALFAAARLFDAGLQRTGERLAILTNGGGAGVLAVDALAEQGERLAELSPETLAALDALAPQAWSHGNPVDVLGDATPERMGEAARILLVAKETDALLALTCPTALGDVAAIAEAVVDGAAERRHKPVLAAWLGGAGAGEARRKLAAAHIPDFDTPEAAAEAFAQLSRLSRNRQLLLHAPDGGRPPDDLSEIRRRVTNALSERRTVLTDPEARAILAAYGVPVAPSVEVATPAGAATAARAFGAPVALKVLSRQVSHKSDVGGVRLGLVTPEETRGAAEGMLEAVRAARPDARIEGFIVEPMVMRAGAVELLAGVVQDPAFGPVVLVGQGGVAAEVVADRALGLPPLGPELAQDMIGRTRVSRLLAGFRDRPPADVEALAACLEALGRLATDIPEIVELDINPLLCDAHGVLALDARIALKPVNELTPKPAIEPYPRELTREVEVGGEPLTLRAIRPSDADRLREMADLSAPEDIRLRFRSPMRHLTEDLVLRLTQIDYDRQMALVAEDAGGAILGVARLAADPAGETAEFALMVRTDRQRRGLGGALMRALLDYAQDRGLRELWGDVAYDNDRMLTLARELGFVAAPAAEAGRLRVSRGIGQPAATVS